MKERKWMVRFALLFSLIMVFGLMFAGCAPDPVEPTDPVDPDDPDEPAEAVELVVGTKDFHESMIIGEMLKILIEHHSDIAVDIVKLDGGTAHLHPAMEAGDVDMYPEYTGTSLLFVLEEELILDPDVVFQTVRDEYLERYNFVYFEPYGFNNTYTLAVTREFAEEHGVETFSDLAEIDDVVLGAEFDFFERPDGYDALAEEYGYDFEQYELSIGLKYQALAEGEVDVINAFATDGMLQAFDLLILEDDQNFFPPYHCATVVRAEALEQSPELEGILEMLEGRISDEKMAELNYLADVEEIDVEQIAFDFLEEEGLL